MIGPSAKGSDKSEREKERERERERRALYDNRVFRKLSKNQANKIKKKHFFGLLWRMRSCHSEFELDLIFIPLSFSFQSFHFVSLTLTFSFFICSLFSHFDFYCFGRCQCNWAYLIIACKVSYYCTYFTKFQSGSQKSGLWSNLTFYSVLFHLICFTTNASTLSCWINNLTFSGKSSFLFTYHVLPNQKWSWSQSIPKAVITCNLLVKQCFERWNAW